MKLKDYSDSIISAWRLSLKIQDEIQFAKIEDLNERHKSISNTEKLLYIKDYISERIEKLNEIKKEFGI